jgi:hypothetical protein
LAAWARGDQHAEERVRLLQGLIAFFVRHRVIAARENNEFERVVFPMAKNLRETGDFDYALDQLRNAPPDDETFLSAFENVVVQRQKSCRYLLVELERHVRHTELEIGPATRVHIEHIYPRQPLAGERLDEHASVVGRLGNLTLLLSRLNISVRNARFDKKRPSYKESDLVLTRELAVRWPKTVRWDAERVAERQRLLAERALKIWRIP